MYFWHHARDDNLVKSDAKKCQHTLSLSQDFSTTFTPKLPHTLSYSNTTSTKENSTMKFGIGISNSGAGLQLWVRPRASRRSGNYRRHSNRLAAQVVVPASPTSWPNGLPFLLMLLYFMVKQGECSFRWKCALKGAEWR